MVGQRVLSFATLDEIMSDVEQLRAGHHTIGLWTLGQILYHLAMSFRLTTRGAPPSTSRPYSEALRRRFFRSARFPDGTEAPHPLLLPPADCDVDEQAKALARGIARLVSATGPFPDHPVLGPLDKAEWERFHCIHCAHHLGFGIPDRAPGCRCWLMIKPRAAPVLEFCACAGYQPRLGRSPINDCKVRRMTT